MEECKNGEKCAHYHVHKDIIDWPNFPPPDHPRCGFLGELCPHKKDGEDSNCKYEHR